MISETRMSITIAPMIYGITDGECLTVIFNPVYWQQYYFLRRIPITETYTLNGLYPNTLYYIWLAARSQRGEGATTPPIAVRTKQYGMSGAFEGRVMWLWGTGSVKRLTCVQISEISLYDAVPLNPSYELNYLDRK